MVQIRPLISVRRTMPNRRLGHKIARAQRHAQPPPVSGAALPDPLSRAAFRPAPAVVEEPARVVVREAHHVERLAYTRSQAAQALGIARSTFTQRVLPYVDTVETPSGTKLIPADELDRLLIEWRHPGRPRPEPRRSGRRAAVPRTWSSGSAKRAPQG
jgi:hypothetical protein